MKFEDVLHNGKLWSVVYDTDTESALQKVLTDWLSPNYLALFFTENKADLEQYFRITNVDAAIYDTIADATSLACVILDFNPDANLDVLFRPLENTRIHEMMLSREKAKGKRTSGHPSWLRLYAIRLGSGNYLITGGAIKLTPTMAERQHTLEELNKMEHVRNYLIDNGVYDISGLEDLNT